MSRTIRKRLNPASIRLLENSLSQSLYENPPPYLKGYKKLTRDFNDWAAYRKDTKQEYKDKSRASKRRELAKLLKDPEFIAIHDSRSIKYNNSDIWNWD